MAAPTVTPTASAETFDMPPYVVVLALVVPWAAGAAWNAAARRVSRDADGAPRLNRSSQKLPERQDSVNRLLPRADG